MNFNNIKDLCKEHDELLEKIKIIDDCNKKRHWIRVSTPESGEFSLSESDKRLLNDCYENRCKEIETTMDMLLYQK